MLWSMRFSLLFNHRHKNSGYDRSFFQCGLKGSQHILGQAQSLDSDTNDHGLDPFNAPSFRP
jgi:hypothetical protein